MAAINLEVAPGYAERRLRSMLSLDRNNRLAVIRQLPFDANSFVQAVNQALGADTIANMRLWDIPLREMFPHDAGRAGLNNGWHVIGSLLTRFDRPSTANVQLVSCFATNDTPFQRRQLVYFLSNLWSGVRVTEATWEQLRQYARP